jgi:hypothetical protein
VPVSKHVHSDGNRISRGWRRRWWRRWSDTSSPSPTS